MSYDALLWELRHIFRVRGTVEYDYALLDDSLREVTGLQFDTLSELRINQKIVQRTRLRPYPGVTEGLELLRLAEIPVVCLSDSHRTDLVYRLSHTGLLPHFHTVYCRPEYPLPPAIAYMRSKHAENEVGVVGPAKIQTLPMDQRKPDPKIMTSICADFDVDPRDVVLLGDNLLKDVALARASKVFDCWARYGFETVAKHNLRVLLQLTDWPPEAVDAFLEAKPESTHVYPSKTFDSFDVFVGWVLSEWRTSSPKPDYIPAPAHEQPSFDVLLQNYFPFDTMLPT